MNRMQELRERTGEIIRLRQALGILMWDQQTYMPSGGAGARAEQAATLSRLLHTLGTSPEYGALLAAAEEETAGNDPEGDDVCMLRVLRRDYDRAMRLPGDLVAEITRQEALSHEIWLRARADNDFSHFAPALKRMFHLARRSAECMGYVESIYDPLLDQYEPGMRRSDVAGMFDLMKPDLVDLTHAIAGSRRSIDDSLLRRNFPVELQRQLTLECVQGIGFDLQRGRQDEAAHPFCSSASRYDVRITTRYSADSFSMGLYSSLHEAGHGMYDQGVAPEYDGTALEGGASLGLHESQSRLWENLVGRSRPFCDFLFPRLRALFPEALAGASADDYYRAINRVEPSVIRVEADEVTYNLHILMRFELECDLLNEALDIEDLPEAWNAKSQEYLGIRPANNADGVLQDVHWASALIGYFPTYSLGNLVSAQLWHAARRALPELDSQLAAGEFSALREWLGQNVHRHGKKYLPDRLIRDATGESLTSRYYVTYLKDKYSALYAL